MKISKKELLKVIKEEVSKALSEESSTEFQEVEQVLQKAKQIVEKALNTNSKLKGVAPVKWKESVDDSKIEYGFITTDEQAETEDSRYVFGVRLVGAVEKYPSIYDDSTETEVTYKFDVRGHGPKSLVFKDSTEFLTALKEKMNTTGWMSISKDGFKGMPSWGTKGT